MMRRSRIVSSILSLALAVGSATTGCAQKSHVADAEQSAGSNSKSVGATPVDLGAQCTPFGKAKPEGPKSYSIADIGRPGVPKLTADQLVTIRSIHKRIHSPFLRFVFAGQFIVFDATGGPCLDAVGIYKILNGLDCNEFYEPANNPYTTTPGSPGYHC
jgi:hypothetical protein